MMLILNSCRTCPEKIESEPIQTLNPGSFPEPVDISSLTAQDKKVVLGFFADAYSEHLKLLLSARTTGMFVEDIESEIQYCHDVLDWLESFSMEGPSE